MKKKEAGVYICPDTLKELSLRIYDEDKGKIVSGELVSENGNVYPIKAGIPDLTFPSELPGSDADAMKYYNINADVYDEYLPLTFMTFSVDEFKVRNEMIDDLHLKPDYTVIEIGAGTGRDSELIAERLSPHGKFYVQDISLNILKKSFKKLNKFNVPIEHSVFNGCYIPFPDNYFDAVYHFGGLNTFSDIKRTLEEINRVTKINGRVVIGDESMPPWLRDTIFGKILMNSNPLYRFELPLEHLPVSARDVRLRWIIGGVFYVFDYTVGEGEPQAVLDFEIPGHRGGTHLTRYYGQIEGVTEETKRLAYKAIKKTGKSMHKWLDDIVRKASKEDLGLT